MTEKHKSAEAYSKEKTLACETALVLLLQAFGTLKPTVRLIGGLVPRYLAAELAELRERAVGLIKHLSKALGADVWTAYVREEPSFKRG